MLEIKHISFLEIIPIWTEYLWPDRVSLTEPYSTIVYNTMPYEYDHTYKYSKPTFIALYDNNNLVGVNSGHPTGKSYRSRGLYVFEKYRGHGYGTILLSETTKVAKEQNSSFIWSMPRESSMKSYAVAGFELTSEWFPTETSDHNAYVSLNFDK